MFFSNFFTPSGFVCCSDISSWWSQMASAIAQSLSRQIGVRQEQNLKGFPPAYSFTTGPWASATQLSHKSVYVGLQSLGFLIFLFVINWCNLCSPQAFIISPELIWRMEPEACPKLTLGRNKGYLAVSFPIALPPLKAVQSVGNKCLGANSRSQPLFNLWKVNHSGRWGPLFILLVWTRSLNLTVTFSSKTSTLFNFSKITSRKYI